MLGVLLLLPLQLVVADEYDALFQKMMDCNPSTAAFAISAVKDGKLELNRAYGKANREKDIDVTNNTRFSIGSISKEFTGYMAGKQVLEGHYDWQEKITDIFAKKNVKMSMQGAFRNKTCTLDDAMTHRTGIKMHDWLLTDDRDISRSDWVTKFIPLFQEELEMRSSFYYNNWFYTLVGYLVELFGGKSFEKQVKESIFDPLEMTQSCFVSDDEFDALSEEDFAQPYQEGEDRSTLYPVPKEAMKSIGIHNPAGGIISTAGDMAKFMIGVIDALNGKDGAKLSKDVMESITEPKTLMGMQLGDATLIEKPTFNATFKDSGYAYGHIIGTYRGYKYVNHGGSTYGHYSYITVIPSQKIGVFTVISGNNYKNTDMWRMQKPMQIYMLDKLMKQDVWLDAENACTFPKPWVGENTDTFEGAKRKVEEEIVEKPLSVEEAEYVRGNYSNPVYPTMKLKLEDSQLKFEMGNSNGTILRTPGENENRLKIILNMPVDPLNLPEKEKMVAYLIYPIEPLTANKVKKLEFEMGQERYQFTRNASDTNRLSVVLVMGAFIIKLLSNNC